MVLYRIVTAGFWLVVCHTLVLGSHALAVLPAGGDEQEAPGGSRVSAANEDGNGFLVHRVTSAYQAGETEIRVLLPDRMQKAASYAVLYVLPVEAGGAARYGDGLLEIKRQQLHNKYALICVQPTFSHLPWYADHATDPRIRQESYFLNVVLPLVEETYPVLSGREGRLLLGFSKSGWGALSLLLRHPDLFARAAAWDAPLEMDRPNRYGMGEIFGSQENFEKHRITALLKAQANRFNKTERLVLLGYGNFRSHHEAVHALMRDMGIRHQYVDGPKRRHAWDSGWVAEAVRLLVDAEP